MPGDALALVVPRCRRAMLGMLHLGNDLMRYRTIVADRPFPPLGRGNGVKAADYPPDWKAVSRAVRDRSGGRCECEGECGLHRTHPGPRRCNERQGEPAVWARGRIVLTVAHLNADGGPCRCEPLCGDPEHLRAMCQRCHLRYDAPLHRRHASATRYRKRNNLDLFHQGGIHG
jgi:hypothetical protein